MKPNAANEIVDELTFVEAEGSLIGDLSLKHDLIGSLFFHSVNAFLHKFPPLNGH